MANPELMKEALKCGYEVSKGHDNEKNNYDNNDIFKLKFESDAPVKLPLSEYQLDLIQLVNDDEYELDDMALSQIHLITLFEENYDYLSIFIEDAILFFEAYVADSGF